MALPVRRSYAGAGAACTLASSINSSATSFSITGTTTGWPTTSGGGFYMVIDPGLSTEEKVLVGARTSGSLSSVTRGVDGTTAASHDAGATCYPVFTAVDANEANLLASTMTTKGDLLSTDGSDPKRVAVGSNNQRLVADSAQTAGIKWVADTQNTVVDAKGDLLVGSANDTVAALTVGANNTILVADSAATNGVKWAALSGIGGAWTAWTPTVTASSGSITTSTVNSARYIQIGKLVVAQWSISISNVGTASGYLQFSLPVTAQQSSGVIGSGREGTATGNALIVLLSNTTTAIVYEYDNTSTIGAISNSGIIIYEAA